MHHAGSGRSADKRTAPPSRPAEQLRNSFNHSLYAIKLSTACRMYGVVLPVEHEGYRAHNALYDAELAGRLYFAMRGIAYVARAPSHTGGGVL